MSVGVRAFGLGIVLLAGGLSGCGQKAAEDPRTAAPLVRTVIVAPAVDAGVSLTGVVHSRFETDLGFRAAGKIAERLVDAGQHVKKGQPLMRLDVQDYALAAAAADAQYAAAQAQADRAAADEKRLRGLVKTGAISAQAYDQARAGADAAEQQARAAAAQRDVARRQRGYSTLEADADGVVMSLSAEVGQVVSAGQPVLRLAHDGPREAVVSVPEAQRATVPQTASASLFTQPGKAFTAHLRQLSAAADPVTRTYEARYVLDAEAQSAPLGATVSVRLDGGGSPGGVSAPLTALVDRGGGSGVFIVDPVKQTVKLRSVVIASLAEESARIRSGLQPGEQIVSLGVPMLHDGQHVRIEPAQ